MMSKAGARGEAAAATYDADDVDDDAAAAAKGRSCMS
jgi:hypothetical protein